MLLCGRVEAAPGLWGREGGQGRLEAARRGSLEGPVSEGDMLVAKPGWASWSSCVSCARLGFSVGVGGWDVLRFVSRASDAGGQCRGSGCRSSLRRGRGDMECFGRSRTGSIKGTAAPLGGGHDKQRARVGLRPDLASPFGVGQAADLAVA